MEEEALVATHNATSEAFVAWRKQAEPFLSSARLLQLQHGKLIRSCQNDVVEALRCTLDMEHPPRVLFAQLSPGSGKTLVIAIAAFGALGCGVAPCRTRVLICVPSVGALENLRQLFHPTDARHSLLSAALQLPEELLAQLRRHVCVLDRSVAENAVSSAWVVLSTWQMLYSVARTFEPDAFSNIIVDEGDYGTVRTNKSTSLSWCNALERFVTARTLLLSGTRHRSDNVPLPQPFFVYSYSDALRDGVVKRVQFVLLQPDAIEVCQARDMKSIQRKSYSKLTIVEQAAARKELSNIRLLIQAALIITLAQRRYTGVPWLLHVITPRATTHTFRDGEPHIESVVHVVNQEIEALGGYANCRVGGARLTVASVWAGQTVATRAGIMHDVRNFRRDVIVTCRAFSRAVSLPLIGVTLNLRAFPVHAVDDYEQSVIGRGIRVVSPADVRNHPRATDITMALQRLQTQRAVVLESVTNDPLPVMQAWAARMNSSHREAKSDAEQTFRAKTTVLAIGQTASPASRQLVWNSVQAALTSPMTQELATPPPQHRKRPAEDVEGRAHSRVLFRGDIDGSVVDYILTRGLTLRRDMRSESPALSETDTAFLQQFEELIARTVERRRHVLVAILAPGRWWSRAQVISAISRVWAEALTTQTCRKLTVLLTMADERGADAVIESRFCASGLEVEYRYVP